MRGSGTTDLPKLLGIRNSEERMEIAGYLAPRGAAGPGLPPRGRQTFPRERYRSMS